MSVQSSFVNAPLVYAEMWALRRYFTSCTKAASAEFTVRKAALQELDPEFPIKLALSESWDIGPRDFACAYESKTPLTSFIGEVHSDKRGATKIAHLNYITYPGHFSFFGGFLVDQRYRTKGYGLVLSRQAWRGVDTTTHTVGTDASPQMAGKFETELRMKPVWTNQPAFISLEKVAKDFSAVESSSEVSVRPIREVDSARLCDYDSSIFGAPRHKFLEKWISIPGSLGWAAIDGNGDLLGDCSTRQVFRNGGAAVGLNMAPLFADNQLIAKVLLKEAARTYLADDAKKHTEMSILVPEGENGNASAVQLIENELEAECDRKNTSSIRMYTKGAPPNMQMKKIFGLTTLSFG